MKLKIVLSTASALALLTGAAWAGSGNTLYISQNGTSNEASVKQAAGSGGNNIGLLNAPVVQQGDRNYFSYNNADWANSYDNDIAKLRQDGDDNWFSAKDSDGAVGNRINDVLQDGDTNQASISRRGDDYSTVKKVTMSGDRNVVTILQADVATGWGGHHNTVELAKINGSDNGIVDTRPQYRGAHAGQAGINIVQGGTYNLVQEASIDGSRNGSWGWGDAIRISQTGNNNGRTSSVARMKGSDGNGIHVSEVGNGNNFDVRQGVSVSSTGNYATVSQLGNYNDATATQYGDNNSLTVSQNGNYNRSTTLFTGSDNGVGGLTGVAGNLVSVSSDLTQGTVFQDSSTSMHGNLLDYTVRGSGNLFAFAQIGGNNTINGKVGTGGQSSDDNQVAVLQDGSNNVSNFSQTGGGSNNLAVSQ